MLSRIAAADLEVGMFVSDLDRPWIDTPFLLQGFLLEDREQIAQLQKFCVHVTVDHARSVGDHYRPPPKAVPAQRSVNPNDPRVIIQTRKAPGAASSAPSKPSTATAPSSQRGGRSSATSAPTSDSEKQRPQAGIIISTKDADFRPSESGRFILTATPQPEDQVSPAAKSEPEGGSRSFIGKLRDFLTSSFSRAPADVYDDSQHAGPVSEPGPSPLRPVFLPETVQLTYYEDAKPVAEEVEQAVGAYERTNELLHRISQDIRVGKTLAIAEVDDVITDMVDSMVRNPDALMWVMRLRESDSATYGHGLYTAVYLVALGRHLGFPKDYLARLGNVGLLLDIGKIKLPRELLEKQGRLTTQEYEVVKSHVKLGLEVLSESPSMHPDIMDGIAQHHERENGSGYPLGIKQGEISIFGRMAAIADCFAALTNKRPYAEAVPAYDALRSLSGWGGEFFHAPMVEQFIQAIGVFPVGSMVELSTGEVAIVISHNKTRRLRPKVLIISGPDKSPSKHPSSLDLLYQSEGPDEQPIHIRRGLAAGAFGLDAREFYVT